MKETEKSLTRVCMVPSILLKEECYYCHLKDICEFWVNRQMPTRWEKAMERMEEDMKEFGINEKVPWRI